MKEIDIVVPWVDSSDPQWIQEFNRYAPQEKKKQDANPERYRDYGLMRFWFRGIEKFAPWARTVHFITNGQKPAWLNTKAGKLHWVQHNEYIPSELLPVFSSRPIDFYLHKIPGLSEQFVYFITDNIQIFGTYVFSDELNPLNQRPANGGITEHRFNNHLALSVKYNF